MTGKTVQFPDKILEISISQIEPDKEQPRKEFKVDELVESIKTNGLIQPIMVTRLSDDKYQIVDGERRWQAYQKILEQAKDDADLVKKYSTIRAIYVENGTQLEGIVGNIVRNNYNPMETADAYKLLKKLLSKGGKKATNKEVGNRVNKAENTISEYNTLLEKLPKDIQDEARLDGRVPYNRLKTLATKEISDDEKREEYGKLFKIYSSKQDYKNVVSTSELNKETKRVVLVQKKIKAANDALGKKSIMGMSFEGVSEVERDKLKESLKAIKETADNLLQKLSPMADDMGDL